MTFKRLVMSSVAVTMTFGVPVCFAQSSSDESAETPLRIEEVVVTARKRAESTIDVPFSVSVVSAEALEAGRITDVRTLFQDVPNFSYNSLDDGRISLYQIRGVGPVAQIVSTDDTSVVTYVDGVPQPLFASDVQLIDLERVEVLKGPQGTLFGRNSTAGAINFVTKVPTESPELRMNVETGTESLRKAAASVSGPLGETLTGRLSGTYRSQNGYVPNTATSKDLGSADIWAGRGGLRYAPSDRLQVSASISGEVSKRHPVSSQALRSDPDFPRVSVLYYDIDRDVYAAALDARYELGWATLVSVTGYHDLSSYLHFDNTEGVGYTALFTFFGLPVTEADFLPNLDESEWQEDERQISQEVRLESTPDSSFDWVAGVSYFHSDFDMRYVDRAFFNAPVPNGTRDQTLQTDATAVFGEIDIPLRESLTWSFGLRATREDKTLRLDYVGNGFPGTVDSFDQRGKVSDDFVVGRTSLSYKWAPETSSYFNVGRGYKAGGFPSYAAGASLGIASPAYLPAKTWSFELGHKARFWNGRAQVEAATFYNDNTDEHVFNFQFPNTYEALNLDTKTYGVEAAAALQLGRGFDVALGAGYTVAEFKATPPGAPASEGNRVPGTPRLNTTLAMDYRHTTAWLKQGDLHVRVAHRYVGEREVDAANSFTLDDYHNVGARIGVEFQSWSIYAFGENLLDEHFQVGGVFYAPGVEMVTVARGLTAGLGLTLQF